MVNVKIMKASLLKNRILVQDDVFATRKAWLRRDWRGAAEFKSQFRLRRIEDMQPGTHKDMLPKDISWKVFCELSRAGVQHE
jgi:hypothetical protein